MHPLRALRREWRRLRRRTPADRLERGEILTLHLAPGVSADVDLYTGVTLAVTREERLSDDEARQLLYCARYALTVPTPRSAARPASATLVPADAHTIPIRLSHAGNRHVADVLAAYLRMTTEEPTA